MIEAGSSDFDRSPTTFCTVSCFLLFLDDGVIKDILLVIINNDFEVTSLSTASKNIATVCHSLDIFSFSLISKSLHDFTLDFNLMGKK